MKLLNAALEFGIFSVIALGTPVVQAQVAKVKIGDVDLALGAPVARSINTLKKGYTIRDGEGKNSHFWMVSKSASDFPIATIYSQGGVIVGVTHDLLEKEPDSAEDVFNALFKAASHIKDSVGNACSLQPGSSYTADSTIPMSKTTVYFLCGDYSFYLLRNVFTIAGKVVAGFVAIEEIGITE